jgi:hypothetical protein
MSSACNRSVIDRLRKCPQAPAYSRWNPLPVLLGCLLVWMIGSSTVAQTTVPPPSPPPAATESLHPALNRIGEVAAGLSISRWKAPGEVRSVTQRDIDSIQRDLGATLPPLLDQAAAAPASVPASFAVYRNIDALYDVLLRVSETAVLAAPQADADNLQSALATLESARRELGDAILRLAASHEQEIVSLRAAVAEAAAAAAAKPVAPVKTVVDDGPASPPKPPAAAKHKKKAATAQPAAPPVTPATPPQ